ncbi:MAG: hypothetical protein WBV59_02695 [Anaerolineae bacterium]
MNESLPEVITSQGGACAFCFWLGEHPEVEGVQGWTVERIGTTVVGFGTGANRFSTDIRNLMAERRAFNDWIRTYRARRAVTQ